MSPTTTLILGGGFGGLACARALRAGVAPEHRIQLVDRADGFLVGASKTWVMLGERRGPEVVRERARLLPAGVEWIPAEIESLDPVHRRVHTGAGELRADHLVVALGADLDPAAIPGLAEGAHSFYTLAAAERLSEALREFAGGRIVLLVPRLPFKCPPAPYEAAMLLHAWLEARGLRGRTEIEIHTIEPLPMTTAGEAMGRMIVAELEARRIGFHPRRSVVAVEPARRAVRCEDGEVPYDLLIAVPPHRAPQVVVAAGMAEVGGWVAVDPLTLEARRPAGLERVYAIGDVTALPLPGRHVATVPLVLPKAGVFAAAEGEIVAARIAAAIGGTPPPAGFEGRGFCYLEVGGGRAIRAEGEFFATPHPLMATRPASEEQYRDKLDWVEGWLKPTR